MHINFAHLCDYAFMGDDKLGMIGIFNSVRGTEFPLTHASAFLAYEIGFAAAEIGRKVDLELMVRDEDGGEIAKFKVEIESEGTAAPGSMPTFKQIMPLNNMRFEKAGLYEFAFFLNGNYDRSIHLTAALVSAESRDG